MDLPVTTEQVAAHMAYLQLVARDHATSKLAEFITKGLAPCFCCGAVKPFESMEHSRTGRAFCDHLCHEAYAS